MTERLARLVDAYDERVDFLLFEVHMVRADVCLKIADWFVSRSRKIIEWAERGYE